MKYLKLLDNFNLIIGAILVMLMISFVLKALIKDESQLRKFNTGIFLGSLISISTILIFIIWLSYSLR
ncbi:MAG: hypothetical protein AAF487_12065 [Bacteroidota bacterium]